MNDFVLSLALASLCVLLGLVMWFKTRSGDPYGLFHLTLNKLPSEDADAPPATEWLNMGYWKDAENFPGACKALALKMITSAGLKEGGAVLDVGHGTGESLLLLLSEPSLPRPSRLVGVTSLEAHHRRSVERVRKYQTTGQTITAVDLHHGDAVYDGLARDHPLAPSSPGEFDSILALDCAYHFDTRHRFLEQSFAKLAPLGTIALADICFSTSALSTHRTTLVISVLRLMPLYNLVSEEEYIAQMKDIGFVDVTLKDITPDVFPGFVGFLKSRKWGWWIFGWVMQCYAGAGAKFVIVSGKKL